MDTHEAHHAMTVVIATSGFRKQQRRTVNMTGPKPVRRCRNVDCTSENKLKAETAEYFYPDVLHIFLNEEDSTAASMLSNTPKIMAPHASEASFPKFRELPAEIRYLIWEAAAPEPKIVPRTWNASFGYRLRREVPAVLHACAESRRLLVARTGMARMSTSPRYQLVRMSGYQDGFIYLDWRADSIWICRGCEFLQLHFV